MRDEEHDLRLNRSKAKLEAGLILSMAKDKIINYWPNLGPTKEELEKNPALNAAWEEFQLVYKLTVPESERVKITEL